jgi:hypothetical protein
VPFGAVGEPLFVDPSTPEVRKGEIRFLCGDRVGVDAESESGVSVAQHVGDPANAPSCLQRMVAQVWRVQWSVTRQSDVDRFGS